MSNFSFTRHRNRNLFNLPSSSQFPWASSQIFSCCQQTRSWFYQRSWVRSLLEYFYLEINIFWVQKLEGCEKLKWFTNISHSHFAFRWHFLFFVIAWHVECTGYRRFFRQWNDRFSHDGDIQLHLQFSGRWRRRCWAFIGFQVNWDLWNHWWWRCWKLFIVTSVIARWCWVRRVRRWTFSSSLYEIEKKSIKKSIFHLIMKFCVPSRRWECLGCFAWSRE